MSAPYTLVIGTKTWSSWSLRPWLLMSVFEIPFDEIEIALRAETTKAEILKHSPAGQVPVLKIAGGPVVWDSLAIAEALAERHPGLWPADPAARAVARSVSAEMHAGFRALREQMPMDVLAPVRALALSPDTAANIARIQALWRDARARFGAGGPFLFGAFSIADAMYAPVVSRFMTYGVTLGPVERAYGEAIGSLPAMTRWRDACAAAARGPAPSPRSGRTSRP